MEDLLYHLLLGQLVLLQMLQKYSTSASVALTAETITILFLGSPIGFWMGSYLITKHCKTLLDKFVEIFI